MDKQDLTPAYQPGDEISGFTLKRAVPLPRLSAVFYELKHNKTGARYIHLANKDRENTFSVAFKTVPQDSTGVAHILEHTALCGSRSFPVRDPFFSMIKRSMNSFMNAFTSSDWTMYPYSTCNQKDFYNLMQVYLDAAFFPKLDELSFKQEGFRVEEDGDGLVFKGVVYNEMKGAMSSPRDIMGHALMEALYPDVTYGNNSGGDPAHIVDLTHADLVAFHQRHYHPSNAFFYTYGALPLEGHLKMIEERVLSEFEAIDPKTDVEFQPRWDMPKEVHQSYPVAPGSDTNKKGQIAVAWLTCPATDSFEVLALDLLESVLLGNSASPLRKALIESGLGSSLADGTGFHADSLDTMFSVGLKNADDSDPDAVKKIVFDSLNELVKEGIDKTLVDAAIHQYEFQKKEVTNNPMPYGIKLLLNLCSPWFHHGDPVSNLKFDDDLDRLRKEAAKGGFFEGLIKKHFLENNHQILMVLHPDEEKAADMEAEEKEKLEAIAKTLTQEDRETIRAQAQALEKLQEAAEDVSCLPTLGRGDIDDQIQTAHPDPDLSTDGVSAYVQPTNGIVYYSLVARTQNLPVDLLPLLPLFCHVLPKMGSKKRGYVELTRDMAAYTGGIGAKATARTGYNGDGKTLEMVAFASKCLDRNLDRMFDLIKEILFERSFADHKRLDTLVGEYVAALESSIVPSGHQYAISLASRGYSRAKAIEEAWHGVHQLQTAKDLAKSIADDKEAGLADLADKLEQIAQALFVGDSLETGLVGEAETLAKAVKTAEALQKDLAAQGTPREGVADFSFPMPEREAWTTSSQVSFVAHVFPTVRMTHPDAPALAVIAKMLRSLFIHREIREKGGAYGGYAMSNAEEGLFGFASYRDPQLARTIDVFARTYDFILQGDFSDQDVTEAILQVCSDIDKPDAPSTLAQKAFYAKLLGLTDEARKDYKKRVAAVTRTQVMEAAKTWFRKPQDIAPVAAITSKSLLEKANEQLENPLKEIAIG
ncbi:insulinase family protein [Desulfatibacillum aliphaticivorans]|uniref:insulinase family protein n=1 Tax=Desulfatibacillum aliphaticivorans TaxID=218208 RepID=UPI00040B0EA5|nr:insulinase family protein [Desulfatibacillum aliphaticivorans]